MKEIKKQNKYLDLAKELKKPVKHVGYGDTYRNWSLWNSLPGILKRYWGNRRSEEELKRSRTAEIGQVIEKSHGNLKRLAVT